MSIGILLVDLIFLTRFFLKKKFALSNRPGKNVLAMTEIMYAVRSLISAF